VFKQLRQGGGEATAREGRADALVFLLKETKGTKLGGREFFNHEWTLMAPSTDYALKGGGGEARGGGTHWFLQESTERIEG